MSEEIVRRRLVVRFTGSDDTIYTDKVTEKIVALEKQINSEIEFINKLRSNGSIVVKMKNGEAYEFFGWRDPYKHNRDSKKRPPPDYVPPEPQSKKLTDNVTEDPETEEFGIVHFVLLVLLFGLACFGGIIIWHVHTTF